MEYKNSNWEIEKPNNILNKPELILKVAKSLQKNKYNSEFHKKY